MTAPDCHFCTEPRDLLLARPLAVAFADKFPIFPATRSSSPAATSRPTSTAPPTSAPPSPSMFSLYVQCLYAKVDAERLRSAARYLKQCDSELEVIEQHTTGDPSGMTYPPSPKRLTELEAWARDPRRLSEEAER